MITLTSLKRSQVIRKAKLHIVQQTHRNTTQHSTHIEVDDRSESKIDVCEIKCNKNTIGLI